MALVGLFEALSQPVSVPPSQDTQPEGEGGGGHWGSIVESELEEELSSKLMFYLTPTAESHRTTCCHYGQARRLSTCICMQCMRGVHTLHA